MNATLIQVPANDLLFSGLEWGPADGPLALLLHGFPQRAVSWTGVAERLAEVGVRVVAIDQRGYSPAARPTDVDAYALPHLVGDAAGLIAWLGGSAHLVGHDWGAVVGWQLAARRPDLVRTWTAVSTPNPLALAAVLASSDEQRQRFGYMKLFRTPGAAEDALLGDGAAGLRRIFGPTIAPDRVDADVEFFAAPGVLTAALNWYRAMSPSDNDGVAPVAVPTTYVWGEDDFAFGRAAAESSGDYVSAPYSFVPLAGVTHWVADEAPDAVAEAIAERIFS